MKTIGLIIAFIFLLMVFVFCVWPYLYASYLWFLPIDKLEEFVRKRYNQFQQTPDAYNCKDLRCLKDLADDICRFWEDSLNCAKADLEKPNTDEEKVLIQNNVTNSQSKFDYWCKILIGIENEIEKREYFNSFRT